MICALASVEWKSYANLHKFDTANPHIAEGLIWAGLCAAVLKRFLAHAAQRASRNAQLVHWLIFSTNHLRGLEEMKRAMWKADKAGEYRFSDRVGASPQETFFSMLKDEWLADELTRQLSGRSLYEEDLREFVLVQTPLYLYKKAVEILRRSQRVSPAQRGSWPIRFH